MVLLPNASRHTSPTASLPTYICQQCRHATLIKRPRRPYQFTQLVTLSDGSSYLHRTTSPAPIYRSTKDTRNSMLWNPSSQKLMTAEADEAGKLRAFRERFGRGWDAKSAIEAAEEDGSDAQDQGDSLIDLITEYAQEDDSSMAETKEPRFKGKGKKK